jgi:hypothetical protein
VGLGWGRLAVGDMSGAACFENVLAALDTSQKDRLAAGVKRPVLFACMSTRQAVIADYTQGGFVVNAGQFGLDTGGELRCCCHTRVVGRERGWL